MRGEYRPDELLPLSGIQHFCFCRRQWALIHVECQWQDNLFTVEGKLLHNKADDPFFTEVRNGVIRSRAMPVASYRLGLYGICDVVEFTPSTPSKEGARLHGREGVYLAAPVEYKRGKKKSDHSDEAQLCAQAVCLEEMLSIQIPKAYIFYAQTRRRTEVDLTEELRDFVQNMSDEMHSYFSKGYTPQVKASKACRSCSLEDICLPNLQKQNRSACQYIQEHLDGE